MKVLIAAQGYFPAKAYGGPPVSIANFCNLLKEDIKTYIVTANHEYGSNDRLDGIQEGWQKVGNAKVLYLSEKQKNINMFSEIVKEIQPDLIYLNSLFDAPNVLAFLEIAHKNDIKVLMAPRGELCSGAFKKKYKKIPYIAYIRARGWLKNVLFQSTSNEETEAIKKYLGADLSSIFFLTNIPSIPKKEYDRFEKVAGKGRFVFLSRIHPKKNLISAIRYFNGVKGNVTFDIFGPIEDKEYWKECQTEIEKLSKNVTVNYCGLVSHDEVHEVFSRYDAFLFPTLSENYGHVIAEALFVGTPVIISDQTPWNDINTVNAGAAIGLRNYNLFSSEIQKIVDMDNEQFFEMSRTARRFVEEKSDLFALRKAYLDVLQLGDQR